MRQDNPKLEQLRAAYDTDPAFAEVAERVANNVLEVDFRTAANANPNALTTEMQLIGSLKRLVCNTILETYEATRKLPCAFDPAAFLKAQRSIKARLGEVQGFYYEHNVSGSTHEAYDYHLHPTDNPRGRKTIFSITEDPRERNKSEQAAKAEYTRCHVLMTTAIEEYCLGLAWAEMEKDLAAEASS